MKKCELIKSKVLVDVVELSMLGCYLPSTISEEDQYFSFDKVQSMAAYVPSLGPIWTMEMAIRLFFSQYGPFKMSGYREKKKKSCVGLPQHSGIMISEESSYSEWHLNKFRQDKFPKTLYRPHLSASHKPIFYH